MAITDKNIVITPNIGAASDPKIVFSGADASTAAQNITLTAYPTNGGTLSFDGSTGQLFSVTNNMTGTIFSANDVSGIPSIEVIDTGLVKIAQYSGNLLLGSGTDTGLAKLQVTGAISSTGSISAAGSTLTGKVLISGDLWAGGTNGALTIRGAYPSMVYRSTTSNSVWLIHNDGSGNHIWYSVADGNADSQAWTARMQLTVPGVLTIGGNAALHAGNYNSYSPTLGGTGASGSWAISVTGNAATATTATTATYLSGTGQTNCIVGKIASTVDINAANDTGSFSVRGDTTYPASMSFHRVGAYAINIGLSTSNEFVIGGWSASSNAFRLSGAGAGTFLSTIAASNFSGSSSGTNTGDQTNITGNAGTATLLNSSHLIARVGSSGNWNTDFTNTAAGNTRLNGDIADTTNNPGNTWWFMQNMRHTNDSNIWGTQVAWGWEDNANRLAQRNVTTGTWSSWVYYLNSSNYSSYAVPLSGGVSITGNLTFNQPSGLYFANGQYIKDNGGGGLIVSSYNAINLTGTTIAVTGAITASSTITATGAISASNLNPEVTQTDFNLTKSPGLYHYDGAITNSPDSDANYRSIEIGAGNRYSQLVFNYSNSGLWLRRRTDTTWSGWNKIIHDGNYNSYAPTLSGAGASGTWGITAANVSSISSAVGNAYIWTNQNQFQSNLGTTSGTLNTPPLQVYATGTNAAFMSFHRAGSYAVNVGLDSDNILRIGGWSASANRLQMDMSGNLTMAGNVTAYSDERLKKDWDLLPIDFVKNLALVKVGTFTRIDSNERQVGVSAQSLITFLPEAVQDDGEYLSVAYGNAALASAVELAKEVVSLNERIARLEALVSQLIEG